MAEKTEAPKDLVICPYSHLTSSRTLNPVYCFVLFLFTSGVHALSNPPGCFSFHKAITAMLTVCDSSRSNNPASSDICKYY